MTNALSNMDKISFLFTLIYCFCGTVTFIKDAGYWAAILGAQSDEFGTIYVSDYIWKLFG